MVVAAAGIIVDVAATWVLARADRASLNVAGAFRHVEKRERSFDREPTS